MSHLISADVIDTALEFCSFRHVPDWTRPVLVVWPHAPALVTRLLEYGCVVTLIVDDIAEYQRLITVTAWEASRLSRKLRIVYGDSSSYVAAAALHSFVAIFIANDRDRELWQPVSRRVLAWNGRLNCFGGDDVDTDCTSYEKSMGWMLMSYPRCGTHMLATALNSHSKLTCYGEVFNPASPHGSHMFETVPQVLERSWPTPQTGFAVHSSIDRMGHPLNMASSMYGQADFWKHIPDFTPTILVTRRNLLARYVSQMVAMATGVWNSTDASKRESSYANVYVDIKAFERDMKYVQDCWDNAAAYFKYAISIVYEDAVADFDGTMHTIQDYLRVPYEPLIPATVKLAVGMDEIIENYTQVRAWCRRTGHSHFLEEHAGV